MKLRIWGLVLSLLFTPVLSLAVTCAAPTVVPADGRIVDFDFVANTASNYYQFTASAGHSYSVEIRQDYDDVNTFVTGVVANAGGSTCPNFTSMATGTSNDQITHTETTEPAIPKNATRVSFIATGGVYGIQVQNTDASNGHYISVSVSDTTLYNPRWSTNAGFVTGWGFTNTTSQTITGTLTATDTLANPPHPPISVQVVIPPNAAVFPNVGGTGSTVNMGAGHSGSAVFAYNGPPGAILADAFFINASLIVPTKFEPVRDKK